MPAQVLAKRDTDAGMTIRELRRQFDDDQANLLKTRNVSFALP
jgi:hypothetical protein